MRRTKKPFEKRNQINVFLCNDVYKMMGEIT